MAPTRTSRDPVNPGSRDRRRAGAIPASRLRFHGLAAPEDSAMLAAPMDVDAPGRERLDSRLPRQIALVLRIGS